MVQAHQAQAVACCMWSRKVWVATLTESALHGERWRLNEGTTSACFGRRWGATVARDYMGVYLYKPPRDCGAFGPVPWTKYTSTRVIRTLPMRYSWSLLMHALQQPCTISLSTQSSEALHFTGQVAGFELRHPSAKSEQCAVHYSRTPHRIKFAH